MLRRRLLGCELADSAGCGPQCEGEYGRTSGPEMRAASEHISGWMTSASGAALGEAHMELKSFVTETLTAIVEGVVEAQKQLAPKGAHVNPTGLARTVKALAENSTWDNS